jgi:ABC-type Fe3+-hydroxamate transport system substrate-binding protein
VTSIFRNLLTLPILSGLLLGGCSGTSSVTSPADTTEQFSNVLVITIAGDYNVRAQFERVVVSNIRKTGASASPWYSVAGGNKPVVKEDVIAAIQEQGFDAVLAIRRLAGDVELKVQKSRTEIDATPIGGRIVNLFRSDYTDYKTPGSIDFATEALLAVELYSAATQEIVFSFDHQTKKQTNLGLLIDQTAETIVKRIDREGLLAN